MITTDSNQNNLSLSMSELNKNQNINSSGNKNISLDDLKVLNTKKIEEVGTEEKLKNVENYEIEIQQRNRTENSIKLQENLSTIKDIYVVKDKLKENEDIMKQFIDRNIDVNEISKLENKLNKINNVVSSEDEKLIEKYNQNTKDINSIIENNNDFGKNNISINSDSLNQSFTAEYQNMKKNPNKIQDTLNDLNNMQKKSVNDIKRNLHQQTIDLNKITSNYDFSKFNLPQYQSGYLAYIQSNTSQQNVFQLLK